MRLWTVSSEIYVSAAAFYSAFTSSKCRADNIPGLEWGNANDYVPIYLTGRPWSNVNSKEHYYSFAFMTSAATIAVLVSTAVMVCLCCVCLRLHQKSTSSRPSPNAAPLVLSPAPVTYETGIANGGDRRTQNTHTGTSNIYGTGIINFAFTSNPRDPGPILRMPSDCTGQWDSPPDYSTVVSQISPENVSTSAYPVVKGTITVETPPPEYSTTVSPIQLIERK